MADDLSNAGITPKERLARIESLLERMDGKLDNKADAAVVAALELRVRDLETHGSISAQQTAGRVDGLERSVEKLGQKLAYATGTLSAVIVASNMVVAWIINH